MIGPTDEMLKSADDMFKDLGYVKNVVDEIKEGDEYYVIFSKPISNDVIKHVGFVNNKHVECCVYTIKLSMNDKDDIATIDKPLAEAILKKIEETESKNKF